MRVLFLTPQSPYPPRQGTAIRNWALVRHVARHHSVTLLSFAGTSQSGAAPALSAVCETVCFATAPERPTWRRVLTLASTLPDLARRLWSDDMVSLIGQAIRTGGYEVAQIEGLEMAPYVPVLRRLAPRTRIVYDAHNAEHVIQERALAVDRSRPARWIPALYSLLQVPRLRSYERHVCALADSVLCVSAEDARALSALAPGLEPVLIPNGIDADEYLTVSRQVEPIVDRILFTGKMDYRPNVDAVVWFAEEILPRIQLARPDAEFHIVGQSPTRAVQALNGRKGVVVVGPVVDIRPSIAQATVYVAPLRMGGGTRFKILEAMALARPVVSTRLGAEGFPVTDGDDILLANTPEDFSNRVLRVLCESALAAQVGRRGQELARARYDWSGILPELERVYLG
jgi:polysaccharide biosynthesis protein PslH